MNSKVGKNYQNEQDVRQSSYSTPFTEWQHYVILYTLICVLKEKALESVPEM